MSVVVRSRSPLRISFAGGGSDVPPYPEKYGGAVISTSIDRYAYVSIKKNNESTLKIISQNYGLFKNLEKISDLKKYPNTSLISAAFDVLDITPKNIEVNINVDSPPGSGLGSSSALSVSLIGALSNYYGISLSTYEVAESAFELERIKAGIKGGYQDQYASSFGGFNFIEFSKTVTVNSLKLSQEVQNELLASLILCNTCTNRLSGNILKNHINLLKNNDQETFQKISKLKDEASVLKEMLLKGNISKIGDLINEQWNLKKQINKKVTNKKIDKLYNIALKAGATGGKLLGAGGGGHMLFIVDPSKKYQVVNALQKEKIDIVKFNFDSNGLQTWKIKNEKVIY
ncbi:MAG: hypothetical protein K5790_10635 [Nitrosopumilus sp.]|uniref:GHMP family kinase ATP-binding protein n=1 Tax=Nitrosopumilus sp. TaxID=2024843 RepID=UPI00247E1906|nr:hypothetical protein [Nitrosopumilus sp.]MCV0393727.1 hypothetical protein [Nitrosopumilus sp.]